MQSNMTMVERVIIKRNGGKLHGNISRNGYGNAIIGRYGGCFEESNMVGLMHRRKLRGTREASNGGRVRVRIIHGLKINHAPTSSHNGSPYVHATGITNFNTSISTNTQLLTSMTLISPYLYLKTNARNQTSHLFNALYMKVFIISLLDAHYIRTNFIT